MTFSPARVAVLLASVASLLAALAVPVANLDYSSTAGVVAFIVAVATVTQKWLAGQSAHEIEQEWAAQRSGCKCVDGPVDESPKH